MMLMKRDTCSDVSNGGVSFDNYLCWRTRKDVSYYLSYVVYQENVFGKGSRKKLSVIGDWKAVWRVIEIRHK